MNIESLKKQIQDSKISDTLKSEIMKMIDEENVYSESLVQKIHELLNNSAEDLIEQIANLQIQDAVEEFNEESDKLIKEMDEFNREISEKADAIDLANVRADLGIKHK